MGTTTAKVTSSSTTMSSTIAVRTTVTTTTTEAEPGDTFLAGASEGNNHSLVGVAIAISNVLLCSCCAVVWRLTRRRRSLGNESNESNDTNGPGIGLVPGFGRTG